MSEPNTTNPEAARLDEIRARAEKATPGPWSANKDFITTVENLMFCVHARTDIPYLLALVAAKEERIEELEKELGEASSEALVQSYAREGAEAKIKELEAERDALRAQTTQNGIAAIEIGAEGNHIRHVLEAHVASLREVLVEAALPLEAIEVCVDWELHPEIMTAVKDAVKSIRAILQSTKGDGQNG